MKHFIKLLALVLFFSVAAIAEDYNRDVQLTPLLKTDATSIGQKLVYPNPDNGEVTIMKVTLPPGKETGWHKHGFSVFAYVLQGTLTIELDGKKMEFAEGSSFAEVINTFHNGKNLGKKDVVLIAVFLGEKGKPLSEKKEDK